MVLVQQLGMASVLEFVSKLFILYFSIIWNWGFLLDFSDKHRNESHNLFKYVKNYVKFIHKETKLSKTLNSGEETLLKLSAKSLNSAKIFFCYRILFSFETAFLKN